MNSTLRLLLVEDNPADVDWIRELLSDAEGLSFEVEAVPRLAQAVERVRRGGVELVLLDLGLPDSHGLETFLAFRRAAPELATIVLTGNADLELAVAAVKAGAQDFLVKGHMPGDLLTRVARYAVERKRADTVLRETEERYRTLFEQAPDSIMIVDAKDGAIVEFNDRACRGLGYGREDFAGMHVRELEARESAEEIAGHLEQILRDGADTFEVRLRTKQGELRDFRVNCTVTAIQGKSYLHSILRDITEQKRLEGEHAKLEEQLRMAQKMEAIGSLAGGVAHDFNNLLTVILGNTDFALEAVHRGDPLRADLLEIRRASEQAQTLTSQLLAFSRKQILQPKVIDVNRILTELEKMLRRIIGEDIDLVQVLAHDLGLTRADPGQIEQVLMNLAVNARDAMPGGGILTIETANVELDEEYVTRHIAASSGPHVRLSVSDSGCGMDDRTQARIFEPFFTTKDKGKGTGLGLSTVYGIVKQSGGSIWVYSEPGRGTTFKIYLRRELSSVASAITPQTAVSRPRGTETIVIVEDEDSVRNLAARILRAAGYTVLAAAHGGEALLTCEAQPGKVHLVLTDVVMPQMSGRTLAQRLAVVCPEIKVLYMSGYTDNAILHHGVLDPGTNFIGKPFNAVELTRKVREVLDGGPVGAAAATGDGT